MVRNPHTHLAAQLEQVTLLRWVVLAGKQNIIHRKLIWILLRVDSCVRSSKGKSGENLGSA